MRHPSNKFERTMIAKQIGIRRAIQDFNHSGDFSHINDPELQAKYIKDRDEKSKILRHISYDAYRHNIDNRNNPNNTGYPEPDIQEKRAKEAFEEFLRIFPKNRPISKEELYPERDYDMYDPFIDEMECEDMVSDLMNDVDKLFQEEEIVECASIFSNY